MTEENSTTSQTFNTVEAASDVLIVPARLLIPYYFKYAGIAIGMFGTAANALVLYALFAHNAGETKKRVINLLIINQNLMDLYGCIALTISVGMEVNNIYLTGSLGYFLCTIFINGTATHIAMYGSVINLVSLTIERYLKVVHAIWSKTHLKRWIVHAAMAFAWIGGIASATPVSFLTSELQDGICLAYLKSKVSQWIFGSFNVLMLFLLPLITFIYCYWRIVVVIRRQMRVMAGHNVEGSSQMTASQAQSKRVKWNIIKTMIIVSVTFVVCWLPMNVYVLILTISGQTSTLAVGYYPTIFLVYLHICMNPFIYALKHDGVKQQLASLMVCSRPRDVGDTPGSSSNRAVGTQHTRTGDAHNEMVLHTARRKNSQF